MAFLGDGLRPFDRHTRENGLDWPANAQSMIGHKRMLQLQRAAEFVIERQIPGDFIETGVWRGGACILLRVVLKTYGMTDRRVWLADSFEGLPKLQE
jgi:O-methyltransferase